MARTPLRSSLCRPSGALAGERLIPPGRRNLDTRGADSDIRLSFRSLSERSNCDAQAAHSSIRVEWSAEAHRRFRVREIRRRSTRLIETAAKLGCIPIDEDGFSRTSNSPQSPAVHMHLNQGHIVDDTFIVLMAPFSRCFNFSCRKREQLPL